MNSTFQLMWNVCRFLDVNPLWLAFDGLDERREYFLDYPIEQLGDRSFVATMLDIRSEYAAYRSHVLKAVSRPSAIANVRQKTAQMDPDQQWIRAAKSARQSLPAAEWPQFSRYMSSAADAFVRKKIVATSAINHHLIVGMDWKRLRHALCRLTRAPGSKALLARRFGVSAAAVSQWLSGANAPTADTTLRLLEWVTAAEAKQNAPAARKRSRRAKRSK